MLTSVRARKFEPELGGDDDPVPDRFESLANKFLVRERPVDLSGIKEGDATIMGGADELHGILGVSRGSVAVAEPHAPEAESGYFQSSECSLLHCHSP
ncbi:hypothetical protein D3C71_1584720 [compost metagenome]